MTVKPHFSYFGSVQRSAVSVKVGIKRKPPIFLLDMDKAVRYRLEFVPKIVLTDIIVRMASER